MIDFNSKGSNRSIFMPVCLPKTDSPSSNVKGQSVTVSGDENAYFYSNTYSVTSYSSELRSSMNLFETPRF